MFQGKIEWPVQTKNRYGVYRTRFRVTGVEVVQYRNKFNEPCIDDIPDDDDERIMQLAMKQIGCKPPYWNSTSEMPSCATMDKLQNITDISLQLVKENLQFLNLTGNVPCRGLKKFQLGFNDIDANQEDEGEEGVKFEIVFKEWTYKKVKYERAMDLQSLIGILHSVLIR